MKQITIRPPQRNIYKSGGHRTGMISQQKGGESMQKRSELSSVLSEERRMLALLAVALVLQALVAMLQPWPLQAIFDYVILAEPMPEGVQQLLGTFWNVTPESLFVVMIVTLILVALLNGYGLYLQNITLTKVCQAVVQKLRVRLFSHVLKLPITHFYRTEPGETIEHITTDTDDTQKLVEGYSVLAFRSVPTFVGIALIMIVVDWRLALVTLIIAPALVWATYFFGLRIKQTTRVKREYETDISSITEIATKTHQWIKLLSLEDNETKRLEKASLLSRDAAVEAGGWQGWYTSLTNVILALGSAVLILFGVISIKAGRISPGELLVFMSYLRSLYKPVREFTKYYIKISKAQACNERIEDIMGVTSCDLGVCDEPNSRPMKGFMEKIEFENVSFAYEEDPIVQDLSFIIEKGHKIGIIGDSGSGKSTLLNLIPRFFDVTGGRILIDSTDLRYLTLESVRTHIAMVPQQAVLFHATVLENIGLGCPELIAGEDEIRKAAQKANADRFIEELPGGYDTLLRSSNTQLSGGQTKRILLARAFLRDAEIVLLDEPTDGLDPDSENLVMEAFDRLAENRTVVVASHQLKTISNADMILVMRDGKIAERGIHEELLNRKDGIYASFWKMQVGSV